MITTLPKRCRRYGVGKTIGGAVYVHRSCEDALPQDKLVTAKAFLPPHFSYDVVKFRDDGQISFVSCPEFDFADEPRIGDVVLVRTDGSIRLTKASKDPFIYHHKWLMVRDGYDGFDVNAAMERSRLWLRLPGLDKSKIGREEFWKNVVLSRLECLGKGNNQPGTNQPFTLFNREKDTQGGQALRGNEAMWSAEEIEQANRSARSRGAIGRRAITPNYVARTSGQTEGILDYGAGPEAIHTKMLRDRGFQVTAYDFGANFRLGIHDQKALCREYHTVFASNVLNVQASEGMLDRTVKELVGVVREDGRLLANLPDSPRYLPLTADGLQAKLGKWFCSVTRVGGSSRSPLFEATGPRKQPPVAAPNERAEGEHGNG